MTGSAPKPGALIEAALAGDAKSVRDFLRRGANVNERNEYNITALMYAAGEGHVAVVRLLLEHGADLHLRGHYCGTAMEVARSRRQMDVARILEEISGERAHAAESHMLAVEKQQRLNKAALKGLIKIRKYGI